MNSCATSLWIFEITFVEFAITKQNFNLTIHNLVPFESRLYNFIWQSEQQTIALGSIVTPLALVESTSRPKFTHACAWAFPILVLAFVDIAIGVNHLTIAILRTFWNTTFVDLVGNLR